MTHSSASAAPKIALITSQAYSLSNFRGPIMREMIRSGCIVYALAPDHDEDSRCRLAEIGAIPVDFPLERTGMRPIRDVVDAIKLATVLRRIRPEIVLSYFIKPVIYGSLAAWAIGVRNRFALIAGLGHGFADFTDKQSFKRKALRLLTKNLLSVGFLACNGVIFQNEEDRDEFVRSGHLSSKKTIRTNGTGVDLEQLQPLSWPDGPTTFLLAARLIRPKGIVEYAEAARRVRALRHHVHFILLGGLDSNPEGLNQAEVEGLVASAGIEWPGHVNSITPFMERSHVFVLPSYYREGVPRGIQEALACSRAIITTDNIGCRETVDGTNGILVPVKDVDALVNAMLFLIDNPGTVKLLGEASRKIAEKKFDVVEVNRLIMSFLNIST